MRFFDIKFGKNKQYAVIGRVPFTPPKVNNAPVENPSVWQHLKGISPLKFKRLPAQGPMAGRVSLPIPQAGPTSQSHVAPIQLEALPDTVPTPPSRHDSLVDGTALAEGRVAARGPSSAEAPDGEDRHSPPVSKKSSWSFGSSEKPERRAGPGRSALQLEVPPAGAGTSHDRPGPPSQPASVKSESWSFGTASSKAKMAPGKSEGSHGDNGTDIAAWGPLQRAFDQAKVDGSPAPSIDRLDATSGWDESATTKAPARPDPPVTRELKAACRAKFETLGGTRLQAELEAVKATGGDVSGLVEHLNEAGAQAVYQTLRQHFKGKDKASNKKYADDDPLAAVDPLRAEEIERRARQAEATEKELHRMRENEASLEDHLAAGIANCMEMSMASVMLARSLGLKANTWLFMAHEEPEDPSGASNHVAHAYCVIGEVPSPDDPSRAIERLDVHGDLKAPHLRAVDVWSGICGPSDTYDLAFDTKMALWDKQGKRVKHWPRADSVDGEWVRPTSPAWKNHTTGSALRRRKDIQADRGYRPE